MRYEGSDLGASYIDVDVNKHDSGTCPAQLARLVVKRRTEIVCQHNHCIHKPCGCLFKEMLAVTSGGNTGRQVLLSRKCRNWVPGTSSEV